ncbi:MAG: histidinol-phosphatase HisJ family protein [Clostridiales bacterium]|nr:histidinol-phosphatase HisJ family protein [Clostridiales bacterium]
MLADYHIHPMAHQKKALSEEDIALFVEQGRRMGLSEMGFSDHDWFAEGYDFAPFLAAKKRYMGVMELRAGIEVDYTPQSEAETARILSLFPYDYVIGSVHFLDGWEFDNEAFISRFAEFQANELYLAYFTMQERLLRARYDILGHMDLIKVFGLRSSQPVEKLAAPLLRAVAASGITVEINTNGLYKPVGEMYPQKKLIKELFALDVPVTFGSDAHRAEDAGRDLALAREAAKSCGYAKIAGFSGRRRYFLPL